MRSFRQQIAKEDGLPKNICQRCIYKLDMFYEFRLSCISTETILKNYAESLKNIVALNNQVSEIFLYTRIMLKRVEFNCNKFIVITRVTRSRVFRF